MNYVVKFILAVILFVITIMLGIWLHNSGKPFNTLLFTIHKLTALVTVVFGSKLLYDKIKLAKQFGVIPVLVIIIAGALLSLIVSGAILSTDSKIHGTMLVMHDIGTIVTVISVVVLIFYLLK
ncbi:MAG: hypothetical protein ACOC31_00475 [Bacteroidota bacterium]